MSSNLRYGRADAHAVVSLAKENTDILALQELTPEKARLLSTAGLEDAFPFQALRARDDAASVGIWIRYPISTGDTDDDFWLGRRGEGAHPRSDARSGHRRYPYYRHRRQSGAVHPPAASSRCLRRCPSVAAPKDSSCPGPGRGCPEMKARHVALAATSEDPATLEALDAAADAARVRGASGGCRGVR